MEYLTQQFEAALSSSPVIAFFMVYLAGIMTSFTPCVLPLFPVAVGTITASARTRDIVDGKLVETVTSRGRAFLMGMMYALGLATMFSILGLIAALSGKAIFGMLASSPIAYLIIGVIMLLLALWIYKGDRMDPNAWLQNWAFQGSGEPGPVRRAIRWYATTQGGGFFGTFAFGFLSGILAGPCTAPVIAGVLTYVAKVGAVTYGVALMFVYAMGLATLMVVAGMSATLAMRLKKSGAAAQIVKVAFGVMLIAAAGYFFYQAAYFAGWLSGDGRANAPIHMVADVAKEGPEPVKAFAKGSILPDFRYRQLPEKTDDTAKQNSTPAMADLALSQLRGKVVIMPFWGIWCAECVREIPELKKLVAAIENNPRVVVLSVNVLDDPARVPGFVAEKGINYPVVIDAEGKLIERLGAVSFPLNLIIGPDGTIDYSASKFPKDYAARIERLLTR